MNPQQEAATFVSEFMETIIDNLIDDGEVETDFRSFLGGEDFLDGIMDEHCFDLIGAAKFVKELSDFEETDSGLWFDMQPEEALEVKAFYTFKNAIIFYVTEILEKINEMLINLEPEEEIKREILRNKIQEILEYYD